MSPLGPQVLLSEVVVVAFSEGGCAERFLVVYSGAQCAGLAIPSRPSQECISDAYRRGEAMGIACGGCALVVVPIEIARQARRGRERSAHIRGSEGLQPSMSAHVAVGLQVAAQPLMKPVRRVGHGPSPCDSAREARCGIPFLLAIVLAEASAGVLVVHVVVLAFVPSVFCCCHQAPSSFLPRPPVLQLRQCASLVEEFAALLRIENDLSGQLAIIVAVHSQRAPSSTAAVVGQEACLRPTRLHSAVLAAFVRGQLYVLPSIGVVVLAIIIMSCHSHEASLSHSRRQTAGRGPRGERALPQRHLSPKWACGVGGFGGGLEVEGGGAEIAHGREEVCPIAHHEPQRADIVQREAREVGLSLAGIAHGQSVVCHDGMCGSQSAHADGLEATCATIIAQVDTGHPSQGTRHIHHTHLSKSIYRECLLWRARCKVRLIGPRRHDRRGKGIVQRLLSPNGQDGYKCG